MQIQFNHLNFKDVGGQKYLFMPKTEHHDPYFCTIDKLFDAPKKADYSFISEHMIFNVKIMCELIAKIGQANIAGCPSGALWLKSASMLYSLVACKDLASLRHMEHIV